MPTIEVKRAELEQAFKLADASPTLESGDVSVSTRSQTTIPRAAADTEPTSTSGACSLGRAGGAEPGTAGLALVLAALGALRRRRR